MDLLIEITYFALIFVVFYGLSRMARRRGYKGPILGGIGVISYLAGSFLALIVYTYLVSGGVDQLLAGPVKGRMFSGRIYAISLFSGTVCAALVAFTIQMLPKKKTKPSGGFSKVFSYTLLGLILGAIGVIVLFLTKRFNLGFFGALAGFGLMGVGGYCLSLAKRAKAQSADDLLSSDDRPPVLFLRSFSQDEEYAVRVPFKWTRLLIFHPDSWKAKSYISFEEFISTSINTEIGPLIALGNPDDYLPTIGAAKAYQDNETWQHTFAELVQRSRSVLVLEGFSDGLIWELEYLRKNTNPRKIFFLTHPEKIGRDRVPFDQFWSVVESSGYGVPGKTPETGSIFTFNDSWELISVRVHAKTGQDYAEAIASQLQATQSSGTDEGITTSNG